MSAVEIFAPKIPLSTCDVSYVITVKKRESFLTETKRLSAGQRTIFSSDSIGSLHLSDIKLPLKPEFMAKIGTSHGLLFLGETLRRRIA